ncbi:MAG: hypothetical protein PF483_07445, partial [Halothiobacillus sp.]|nr:hypothetical protein [Halothiobacillus sp.]
TMRTRILEKSNRVTLVASFKSLSFRLWNEQRQRFVGFRHLRAATEINSRSAPPDSAANAR